jgi:hypothetical protein
MPQYIKRASLAGPQDEADAKASNTVEAAIADVSRRCLVSGQIGPTGIFVGKTRPLLANYTSAILAAQVALEWVPNLDEFARTLTQYRSKSPVAVV